MNPSKNVKVVAKGEREIVMTRSFQANRELVFDCFTKPELLKRWLFGPDGWILSVCEVDLRIGGKYRYVWKLEKTGTEMGAGGVYKKIDKPELLVCTEKFDETWYPGEALLTNEFVPEGNRTNLIVTILYESKEGRDTVLKSPMEGGVEQSYNRLANLLDTISIS